MTKTIHTVIIQIDPPRGDFQRKVAIPISGSVSTNSHR
jgi:hypothetical protein